MLPGWMLLGYRGRGVGKCQASSQFDHHVCLCLPVCKLRGCGPCDITNLFPPSIVRCGVYFTVDLQILT